MDASAILFYVISVLLVLSSLMVVFLRNVVHCALALVVALFLIAVLFVMLHAPMVGVLQVLVYAGAIMVLFLFVIMFLNPTTPEPRRKLWWGFASVAALLLAVSLAALLSNGGAPADPVAATEIFGSPEMLGEEPFYRLCPALRDRFRAAAGGHHRRCGSGQEGALAEYGAARLLLDSRAVIFAIGVIGVLVRRNLIVVLMSIELMLNAVNLTFIAFSRYLGSMQGQVIVFFVMAVAAAEAVIGLAIVISVFRHRRSLDPQEMQLLKW